MSVLFAAAEFAPVARVGGLAEAASGLVHELRRQGIDVEVVLPDYAAVALARERTVDVRAPDWVGPVVVRRGDHPVAGPVTLVDAAGLRRPHPYVDDEGVGWPDNDRRFLGFSAVVAALADDDPPDVLHLNDWHTAASGAMTADPVPTVLTIHTLGYQGIAGPEWSDVLKRGHAAFRWFGDVNPLAGGIALADRVIAVSPNYAAEILTPDHGMGLHERLRAVGDRLVGIRNGIDVHTWDPAADSHIAAPYDRTGLAGRSACRAELRRLAGWDDDRPVAAMVSRLVDQKGVDLLVDAAPYLVRQGLRFAVLGAGEPHLAGRLRDAADAHPDAVWFTEGYDEALAHRLFAGSDLFVMPSRFEPCGLAQMQAMAYGALPVVTAVGGLVDTVIDADDDPATGTGFVCDVSTAGLVDALHRALAALRDGRAPAIQQRGMAIDWSWAEPAQQHIDVYRALAGGGAQSTSATAPLPSTTTPPSETA